MKKIFLAGMILFTFSAQSQTDQLTALANIPEKTEFVQYYKSGERWLIKGKDTKKILSYKNNELGNLGSFYILDHYVSKKDPDPAQGRPDHYTKPAIFYSTFTGVGEVIIGNLIYSLKRNKLENILKGNFSIEYIYEVKSTDAKELKAQLKSNSESIKTINHDQVLKEYFSSMKKNQEDATANFTEEIKKEIELQKAIQSGDEEARMRIVSEDFNKRHNDSSSTENEIIIINNTGKGVCIVQGGSSHTIGSKEHFDCDDDIYYGVMDGNNCKSTKGAKIASADSDCGRTITLE